MKLTLRPLVVLIGVGVLVGVWALRSDTPGAARPTNGQGIIVFGDSLVAGRGARAGQDFVSVLSRRLGTTIVNAGQSGDTTGAALARLERDVLALNPRIVVVLLGGNDYLRRIPTKADVRQPRQHRRSDPRARGGGCGGGRRGRTDDRPLSCGIRGTGRTKVSGPRPRHSGWHHRPRRSDV